MSRQLPDDFHVDYELARLVRHVRARSLAKLDSFHPELDYNTFVIFIAVCDAPGGVRASDLAENLKVHKSTISRAVSAMERMELVHRVTDPEDGRAQLLTPQENARAALEQFRAESHDWLLTLIADWKPSELATFAAQLGRLNDAMDDSTGI
ncbi:MarR family winged helix-turn-helix transcriptional regulator [Aeromicrobium sp. CTD01-1L150]|uniref:MarR family winged helix-turn-helix transcriptional regulator n=1 Tax=Aeromicrobium sp. CTD01-1L150 TaxID=3341830 RepID=UPI0035C02267